MPRAFRAVPLAAFLLSILAAPAHAENLLPNGGFDTGVAPWFERSVPPTWVAGDAEGSSDSGSVRVIHDRASNVGPVGVDAVRSPCLPIEPGPHTAFADYRVPTGQPVTGDTSLAFWWYANPDCETPVLSAINVARFDSEDSTGAWVRRSDTVVPPEGTTHFYAALSIVRFTPSRVDVEIEQLSTGQSRLYTLDAVPPGTETDLSGLQDREGFLE